MILSIEKAGRSLDDIIANKVAYLEKADNKFIKEEVDKLHEISDSLKDFSRMMNYVVEQKEHQVNLISKLQLSYKLLTKLYEMQILGKLDTRKIQNIEEWKSDLHRLIKTPQDVT